MSGRWLSLVDGATSIVGVWVGILCQVLEREIGSGGAGLGVLRAGWGLDTRILGCFRGCSGDIYFGPARAKAHSAGLVFQGAKAPC